MARPRDDRVVPAKVTRSAPRNAASIAALFLTTEAVIAEKPEKEKAPAGAGAGDMDYWPARRLARGRAATGKARQRRVSASTKRAPGLTVVLWTANAHTRLAVGTRTT